MEFAALAALVAIVKKSVDLARIYLPDRSENVYVPLLAMLFGVAAVFLYGETVWAEGIEFGGQSLAALNEWSKVAVGLAIGSGAGVVHDAIGRTNPDTTRSG